jgi:hypothetical protein
LTGLNGREETADVYGNFGRNMPMTLGEQTGIRIEDVNTEDLRSKGTKCLMGRLGPIKKFNREAFKSLMVRIWCVEGKLIFKELQDHIWLFEFSEEKDKKRVLEGQPWSYDRTILVLNDFDVKIAPSQMTFTHTPIWIQIHNMPQDP